MELDKNVCAYVGRLYLDSQHTLFLLKQEVDNLKKELLAKDNYIEELEKKLSGHKS